MMAYLRVIVSSNVGTLLKLYCFIEMFGVSYLILEIILYISIIKVL